MLWGDADEYAELLKQDTTFVYLKRKADMDAAEALKSEGIVGIYYIEDTKASILRESSGASAWIRQC